MLPPPLDSIVRRTVLPNGVTVLTEAMPHVRTAAFAVYLKQGSRDEDRHENGLSHFLEHFVFRGSLPRAAGSPGRSALDIAIETDLLGGDVDAWTSREQTCYAVEVDAELLARGADLVMDIVARPSLPEAELERERSVIREEMRGYEEDPSELAYLVASSSYWPKHPLGRPVEGTPRTLASFTHAALAEFCARKHVGRNLLACAAGRVDHDEVVELVRAGLGALAAGDPVQGPPAPEPTRGVREEARDHLEQAQVVLSLPGLPATHADVPALAVLTTALGGGMSSRLWQRVREVEGLAYNVSLDHDGYRDCGRLTFHAVTAPENAARALAIFEEEARAVREAPLPAEEFDRARTGLRSSLVLGTESPAERLDELAWGEIVHGRHVPLDERLARLAAVTPSQVHDLARRLLADPRRHLVVVSPQPIGAAEDALGPR